MVRVVSQDGPPPTACAPTRTSYDQMKHQCEEVVERGVVYGGCRVVSNAALLAVLQRACLEVANFDSCDHRWRQPAVLQAPDGESEQGVASLAPCEIPTGLVLPSGGRMPVLPPGNARSQWRAPVYPSAATGRSASVYTTARGTFFDEGAQPQLCAALFMLCTPLLCREGSFAHATRVLSLAVGHHN